MPKPNVDIVTLVAVQELSMATLPTKDWVLPIGDPGAGIKIANKTTIETIGTLVSEQVGSGAVVPDRRYLIVDNAGNLEAWPNGAADPEVTITNDGTGRPRIINDPYLDGKDWSLLRRGTEYMPKGPQWQNDVPGGGFRLTEAFDEFVDGQEYFMIFKPVISNVIVTPDAIGKFSNGEQIVTATTSAGASHARKVIIIQGAAAAAPTYTLWEDYPENVLCVILTGGGSNKQSIIMAPAGQTIWRGGALTRLVLGEVDYAHLVRIGTTWRVVESGERFKHIGHKVFGGIPGPDAISANGQTLQIADYPGLDDWLTLYNAALPGAVVSTAVWNTGTTNRTKWGRNATTIQVPDLRGWFPRGLDLGAGKDTDRVSAGLGSIPGSQESNQNKLHSHGNNGSGLPGNNWDKLLTVNGEGTIAGFDDGPSPQPNLLSALSLVADGGSESRPENVAFPWIINI